MLAASKNLFILSSTCCRAGPFSGDQRGPFQLSPAASPTVLRWRDVGRNAAGQRTKAPQFRGRFIGLLKLNGYESLSSSELLSLKNRYFSGVVAKNGEIRFRLYSP
jgi:hypothetical protein